jgi:hypothetical protein
LVFLAGNFTLPDFVDITVCDNLLYTEEKIVILIFSARVKFYRCPIFIRRGGRAFAE